MSTKGNGGPAFPGRRVEQDDSKLPGYKDPHFVYASGMTLRDYAVIKLAAAMAAGTPWPRDEDWPEMIHRANVGADAIIEARKK